MRLPHGLWSFPALESEQEVRGRGGDRPHLLLVGDQPDEEALLLGEAFAGREGALFDRLLQKAGYGPSEVYLTYATPKASLWHELKQRQPSFVVALGGKVARLLLRLPASAKLAPLLGQIHVVDYMASRVVPWYTAYHLLQSGAAIHEKTIRLLKALHV